MYASHAPYDLWINRRHSIASAFGMVGHVQQKVWQSVKRMAKRTLKEFQKWARFRTPCWISGYGCFSRWPLFASLADALSYSSSRCRLHRLVATFWLSFASVVTMRPLAPPPHWEWYIYISVHTFCKQDILIVFLNRTDVCAQATLLIAFLKRDKSWGHIPPTKNTLYKISSLSLKH